VQQAGIGHGQSRSTGAHMTAVIYNFDRSHENCNENDRTDETERLFSALGRYTSAELLELLYVGEEPGFFELMRAIFALSDGNRLILQNFLESAASRRMTVAIDREGRCILAPETSPA
jgi:hypothetical protein